MPIYQLRSHNIYWDLTRSTEILRDLLRYHDIYKREVEMRWWLHANIPTVSPFLDCCFACNDWPINSLKTTFALVCGHRWGWYCNIVQFQNTGKFTQKIRPVGPSILLKESKQHQGYVKLPWPINIGSANHPDGDLWDLHATDNWIQINIFARSTVDIRLLMVIQPIECWSLVAKNTRIE